MDLVRIDHPTGKPNFSIVRLQNWSFAFSYTTLVGFLNPEDHIWTVCENVWSATTGKHLNYLNPDKKTRVPFAEFALRVGDIQVSVKEGSK